jgi:hypothetical protein
VKFWKFERLINNIELHPQKDWLCFKTIQLQSRAANLKFDDKYMVVSTYFLTVDLYSMQSNQLLCQYMGHTCSITSFDFNQSLMLIVTGSADNSVKYWSMHLEESGLRKESASPRLSSSLSMGSSHDSGNHIIESMGNAQNSLLIKTEANLNWPVNIAIQPYENGSERYLLMVLLANGFIFLNMIDKVDDFVLIETESGESGKETFCSASSPISMNDVNTFNFKYKLNISNTFRSLLSIQNSEFNLNNNSASENFFDDENSQNLLVSNKSWTSFDANHKLLSTYIVTENNSNQSNKLFVREWRVGTSENYEVFDTQSVETGEENQFSFLNKRSLKSMNINQFEIISFGFRCGYFSFK